MVITNRPQTRTTLNRWLEHARMCDTLIYPAVGMTSMAPSKGKDGKITLFTFVASEDKKRLTKVTRDISYKLDPLKAARKLKKEFTEMADATRDRYIFREDNSILAPSFGK